MKKYLFIPILFLFATGVMAQNKNHKFGITSGGYIQHYNGYLGNSFFKFNTVCFGGEVLTFGYYLNKSFDFNLSTSIGDYGYCQTESDANRIIAIEDRCPGCKDRLGMGELRSRMISGNIALKYKFANDFILKEDAKISPYIYLGMGLNHLSDNMNRQCVNEGNHLSLNAGVGFRYNLNDRFNIGYNLGLGYFIKDKVYATTADEDDIKMQGNNDMYMQNALFIGINLF